MDLASFIPGVGPTAAFTPGASTPPPYNVSHTGFTDGAGPTTASNNMAEVYNRLYLQIASAIHASGLTIDNNNWAQLPQAVQKMIDTALDNFSGGITQRPAGNFTSVLGISASTTLTNADAGKVFYISGSGVVVTINPTSCQPGDTYTFVGSTTATAGIALAAGALRPAGLFTSTTSFTLKRRSQVQLVWDGNYFWISQGGGLNDLSNYSYGDIGYVVLESGVTLQWGYDTTSIGETSRVISFLQAFNNNCRSVLLTGRNPDLDITNNNVPQVVTMSSSSFSYFNQGIAEPTQPIQPNKGINWLAIGN